MIRGSETLPAGMGRRYSALHSLLDLSQLEDLWLWRRHFEISSVLPENVKVQSSIFHRVGRNNRKEGRNESLGVDWRELARCWIKNAQTRPSCKLTHALGLNTRVKTRGRGSGTPKAPHLPSSDTRQLGSQL